MLKIPIFPEISTFNFSTFFWKWHVRVFGGVSLSNFHFDLIKMSKIRIQKCILEDFALKCLYIRKFLKKLPPRIHLRQTAIFTRRAAIGEGWRRVLRTIIKIYLKINQFLAFLLYFEWIFQCREQICKFFKNNIFLPYGVQMPPEVSGAFRLTKIQFYLIKRLAEVI